jgi:Sec-independent protein translocase protein TatA
MFNVGIGEVFVILLVCLVVFGPERLPEMAHQAGRPIGQLQLLTKRAPSSSSRRRPRTS